jgi:hypothetical protein
MQAVGVQIDVLRYRYMQFHNRDIVPKEELSDAGHLKPIGAALASADTDMIPTQV